MNGRRVVIADDLTSVLSEVAKLLEESFEIVGMASDGETALDSITALEPDLAVLDISMPGLSGIEVARELTAKGSRPKVVFLTVHEDTDIAFHSPLALPAGFHFGTLFVYWCNPPERMNSACRSASHDL